MVIFTVAPQLGTAAEFVAALGQQGVLMLPISPTKIRAVTHLDVDEHQVRRAGLIVRQTAERGRSYELLPRVRTQVVGGGEQGHAAAGNLRITTMPLLDGDTRSDVFGQQQCAVHVDVVQKR